MPWYIFCPKNPPYDPCNPNNYVLVGSTPPSCPSPKIYLCAIQAADNMGKPIITIQLCEEIIISLNNQIETINVRLRPTLFFCP